MSSALKVCIGSLITIVTTLLFGWLVHSIVTPPSALSEVPPSNPLIISDRSDDGTAIQNEHAQTLGLMRRDRCLERFDDVAAGGGIKFVTDTAIIDPEANETVARTALILTQCPELRLNISGFRVDNSSDPADAQMAERRARSFIAALTANGVDPSHMAWRGFEQAPPVEQINPNKGLSFNPGIIARVDWGGTISPTAPGALPVADPKTAPGPGLVTPPVAARASAAPVWPGAIWQWLTHLLLPLFGGLLTGWWARGDRIVTDGNVEATQPANVPPFFPDKAQPETPSFDPPRKPVLLASIGIPAAVGPADDLLLIKGVGPVLNALLNDLEIFRFDQIARWSDSDIAIVDHHLTDFHGRILRDSWVDQADFLARGDFKGFEARYGGLNAGNIDKI